MKTIGIILLALGYYVTLVLTVVWFGIVAAALGLLGCCCVAFGIVLLEKDEPDEECERESCEGCKYYLGDGHCRISADDECREGGGFELWEAKNK